MVYSSDLGESGGQDLVLADHLLHGGHHARAQLLGRHPGLGVDRGADVGPELDGEQPVHRHHRHLRAAVQGLPHV